MNGPKSSNTILVTKTSTVNIHGPTFDEYLRAWMKGAPWFLVSLVMHLVLCLVLANMTWSTLEVGEDSIINAQYETEEIQPLEQEEPEEESEKEIEKIRETAGNPEVVDDFITDISEEDLVAEDDYRNDSLIDSDQVNDIIGVGGGSGASFSGKYRNRAKRTCGKATAQAIELGLDWLDRHQSLEGFWDCDGFDYRCIDGSCTGMGSALNDPGITGLTLLAFLGAGNTPTEGPYRKIVKRGVRYLCQIQNPEDGCLTCKNHEHYMYNHAIACLALSEAYGLSHWVPIKKHAIKALEFIHNSKNPGKAWRYNIGATDPKEQNDVSVTGWMVMCLASAKDFNLPYYPEDLEDALRYIQEMTDPRTGRTGYKEMGTYSSREPGDDAIWPAREGEAMTAVGMLSRIFCGNILGDLESETGALHQGAKLLLKKPPRWNAEAGTIDYYYWYYGSYAMFQMGGRFWKRWKENMTRALLAHQCMEGCAKGSWPPQVDPWGDRGGRIYSTALCVLSLEAFYRYDNILGGR